MLSVANESHCRLRKCSDKGDWTSLVHRNESDLFQRGDVFSIRLLGTMIFFLHNFYHSSHVASNERSYFKDYKYEEKLETMVSK